MNWGYFAGCVDCDGWITSTFPYVIGFTQSLKREIGVKKICAFLKDNEVKYALMNRNVNTSLSKNGTRMLNIHIKEQKSLIFVLKHIIPFLIFKKNLAEKALVCTQVKFKKKRYNAKLFQEKRKYWTSKEIKKLIKMNKDGYSHGKIAEKLNRSRYSVSTKFFRLRKV